MRPLTKIINKRFYSTPVFHESFKSKKNLTEFSSEKKVIPEKKKIKYHKPSYEHMYKSLPLKCYINFE